VISLQDKFRGCLLGAAVGDMIGAVVEAESPGYIAATYPSVDAILAVASVPELTGDAWRVGRVTDDTQMTASVAEWLIAGEAPSPERLLTRFANAYDADRRYGPGTEAVLRMYRQHPDQWRTLSTAMFPEGSYGNGSAMRVAPVGLVYHDHPAELIAVAIESSRPTHSHSLAYQGVVLQARAVAAAVAGEAEPVRFLRHLHEGLKHFRDLMQDTSRFSRALEEIEHGLARGATCDEMAGQLGTGIDAVEAVPMAIYCFLRHAQNYAEVIHAAVFVGGDTDTIAAMAGAMSGAFLGCSAIPPAWLAAVRDERYGLGTIQDLADRLLAAL
jgi:poly(ADP-ribose) glycohydrolase ARH3